MEPDFPLKFVGAAMPYFSSHSGLEPLVRCLGAELLVLPRVWQRVQNRSWRAGELLRQWGIRRYGTVWNVMVPHWSERTILKWLSRSARWRPVHFWWGEFAVPRDVRPYHARKARVVVSAHCSASRWDQVWQRPDGYAQADHVVLTSESQRPFAARHVPADRISVIPHGVDVDYFRPAPRAKNPSPRFRMWLMGHTERDHDFMAAVARRLPADRFELRIRIGVRFRKPFDEIPCVSIPPWLSDEEMLAEYRQADVLTIPMTDCAANNVILESMACGTPVMVNRVGGIPEYVDPACNFVLSNDRNVDEWVEKLLWLEQNRDVAERMRPATRAWAEKFDWKLIAEQYRAMYRAVLARG